jgi:hypothetical protein
MILVMLTSFEFVWPQRNYISRNWLFMPGDSIVYAEAGYDDSHWKIVDAGSPWYMSGFQYAGYGWYRYHLKMPVKLKPAIRNTGFIKICFGEVSEAAQFFFNGRGLGESGTLPPRFIKAPQGKTVEYYVSENEIRWDTINIIAVRVFSSDSLKGGIIRGPLYYYLPKELK